MKTWKAILGVVLVFLIGVAIGVMLTAKFVELRVRDAIDSGPEEMVQMIERRLTQKLDLTREQRAALRPILGKAQARIRITRQKTDPEIRDILEETRTEVRATLTSEQVRTYDALVGEARRKWLPTLE